jgi:hypothetical protein
VKNDPDKKRIISGIVADINQKPVSGAITEF